MVRRYLFILLIIPTLFSLSDVSRAQFGGPAFETNPILVGPTGIPGLYGDTLVEKVFRSTLAALKKRLLDMMVDQTIYWIQGGGQPMFVTDWKAFFAQTVNVAGGDLVKELGGGFLCRPFGLQLQLAVLQPPRFSRMATCTLDQVVGNVLGFYEDFRRGGFIAYHEMWQPQNNFYGSLLMAMDEKQRRIDESLLASSHEALSGNGFFGTKECFPRPGREPSLISTNTLDKNDQKFMKEVYAKDARVHPNDYNCFISTPGTQVGAAVAKAVGSDIDYLVNSEDLGAYVAAISDALLNRLIREGVGGLRGLATNNLPSASGIVSGNNSNCAGMRGTALQSCLNFLNSKGGNTNSIKKNYIEEINLTLTPLQSAETDLQQSLALQRSLVNKLIDLRTCQINRGQPLNRDVTNQEIQTEDGNLSRLTQSLVDIQKISVPLLNARLQLENPPSNEISDIINIFAGVQGLTNPGQASNLQQEEKSRFDQIKARFDQKIPEIQQRIDLCGRS